MDWGPSTYYEALKGGGGGQRISFNVLQGEWGGIAVYYVVNRKFKKNKYIFNFPTQILKFNEIVIGNTVLMRIVASY